jgi:hypothetical protein
MAVHPRRSTRLAAVAVLAATLTTVAAAPTASATAPAPSSSTTGVLRPDDDPFYDAPH